MMTASSPPPLARDLRKSARQIAEQAFLRSPELDTDASFPDRELEALHRTGLLAAPLPTKFGGMGLGVTEETADLTLDVLSTLGWGSLPLGRIYEGHVNALKLIQTYGSTEQIRRVADDVLGGQCSGVWNTQGQQGLHLLDQGSGRLVLNGGKTFASGAGHIARPLVTARTSENALLMVVPRSAERERADLSGWKAQGMRASATGSFDLTGVCVQQDDIIGGDGDYHRQPLFSGGAWRFCAVQLGGIERLLDITRNHLVRVNRTDDPHQLARLGRAAIAAQGARLWVRSAAQRAEAHNPLDAESIIAFVNLARIAVERAGLDVLELAQVSIGLSGFLRDHPMERVMRDLAVYLRQPAPDKALTEAARYLLSTDEPVADVWSVDEG